LIDSVGLLAMEASCGSAAGSLFSVDAHSSTNHRDAAIDNSVR